ncbi:MAG: (2Fe-2S)-binding protein [Bacteroidetes bacterium]|jgi:bacterioferritin-associated ferredoxin|nr:(2Fe-2S)-binding protein [Bacteroidota bacterium]
MHIDRCYCFQQSFADLKRIADEEGVQTVDALQEHVTFGHNCQLCHPYVRRMLRTGAVTFDRVVRAADEPPTEAAR